MDPQITVRLSELTRRDDINDELTDMLLILRRPSDNFKDSLEYSDVVINVHSGVLRVASPFFMRTINELEYRKKTSKKETYDSKRLCYFLITPYPWVVQRIVYYIYSKNYINLNEEVRFLVPFYQECVRFELSELRDSVIRIFRSQVSLEILSDLAGAAERVGEIELANDFCRILADGAFFIFSEGLHMKLGKNGIKVLLESDNVQLDEVQIFTALCYFLDNNRHLSGPYCSKKIGSTERELLNLVRFCSMAPKALLEFRCDNLDSLLFDAALRILLRSQLVPRVFPWLSNEEHDTLCYDGLYPITLVRVAKKSQIVNSASHASDVTRETSSISKRDSERLDSFFACTIGSERTFAIAYWIFEISKSKNGKLGFGLALRTAEIDNDISKIDINFSRGKYAVFYYDFGNGCFKSGYIDYVGCYKPLKSSLDCDSSSTGMHNYTLKKSDLVVVKTSVYANCINLEISILESTIKGKIVIPYKCNTWLGGIARKPSVVAAPFISTFDIGDTICIPDLRRNFEKP